MRRRSGGVGHPSRRLSSCIFKPGSCATRSFMFEQRRDRTHFTGQRFALLPVHLKAPPPPLPRAPNNRRACYVRRYQHIMNVMDWLVSNPSKRLSLTDVPVNLASVWALSHRYCALSHLRNDLAEAGIRTADLAAALAKIRINRAMLRSHQNYDDDERAC